MEHLTTDVLVIGAGAAGLFAVLHLPEHLTVVVVDKGRVGVGSSPWAQGGVAAALRSDDSPELHAGDTIRVAAGHADPGSVAVLCGEAPECVLELVELGCAFDRNPDGSLHLAREGGQSVARSAHAGDATGAAIMKTLRERAAPRARRVEGACVKLAVADGRCLGAWTVARDGEMVEIRANSTVLATGGIGALYGSTTNPPGATGDGHVLAWEAGAGLADLEFVQFHPTALAAGGGHQRPLLTEALRGAGAYVVDAEGRRFLFEHHSDGELAPRDVVARAIAARHAWLDCRHFSPERWEEFPTVLEACRAHRLDPARDLLPVVPAAHYFVGGVQTDLDGRTSIPRLYAVGECAATGVHGANRLAGNSLAEALVFGRRAARAIAGQRAGRSKALPSPPALASPDVRAGEEWARLRAEVSGALGIVRDPARLAALPGSLEELALLPPSVERPVLELRAGAILARLMARSALLRTESRGGHHRLDHPDPDPSWAGVRLRLART